MDSRLRGNDINGILAVIPAKAGIHAAYPNTNGPPPGAEPFEVITRPTPLQDKALKLLGVRLSCSR